MSKWQWAIPLLALFFVPDVAPGQAPSSQEFSVIREVAEERRQAWEAPGMLFGVVRGEGPPSVGALGIANVDTGTPMEPGMLASFASVSKLVTAATAVVLATEGDVELTAPIRRYLPALPQGLGALTLEQLLSHTAGLGEGTPFTSPSPRGDLRPVCEKMTDEAFVTEPGRVWGYTNMGYTLAGCVLEAAVKASFEQLVRSTLFDPLGMDRTTFSPRLAMTYPHSQGHDTRGQGVRVVRPFNSAPFLMPAGELMSTVSNMARLAEALMNDGVVDGRRVLPEGVLETLAEPRGQGAPLAGGARDYGFGLTSRTYRGERILEHEGVYGGFGASVVMVPDRRIAAIAVTNARYSTPALATQAAAEVLLGHDPVVPTPGYTRISRNDSTRALGRYTALSDTVEIRTVEGRLSFLRGGEAFPISARQEGHWEIQDYPPYRPLPAAPLEIVDEADGEVGFIRLAWRIYRKIGD